MEAETSEGEMITDTVSIQDKVKFWQEQDRINKTLIPRFLKTHELLTDLSRQFAEHSSRYAALEAKMTGRVNEESRMLQAELSSVRSSLEKLDKGLAEVQENMPALKSIDAAKILMYAGIGLAVIMSLISLIVALGK